MADTVLSASGLSAGYGKNSVVKDITFDIQPGEIFGLIGLNGAGKTTLIKTILGLREPMGGQFTHAGKNRIAFLPERFDPPWFLSGFKFLKFVLKIYNKTITEEAAREKAALISLDPEALKRDVKTYSKGMRQKLGLLAAMSTGCDLIILDEPMSGLDPKARQEVKKLILNAKAQNQSVFMSSHILADMAELCDRVAVLHNNRLIFTGAPVALKKKGGDESLEKAFLNVIAA
jgi:ABC-2 type transport system ATP-binding protein